MPVSYSSSHQSETAESLIERLHPSLRASFVQLPPMGEALTREQLQALFDGATPATLRDLLRMGLTAYIDQEE